MQCINSYEIFRDFICLGEYYHAQNQSSRICDGLAATFTNVRNGYTKSSRLAAGVRVSIRRRALKFPAIMANSQRKKSIAK